MPETAFASLLAARGRNVEVRWVNRLLKIHVAIVIGQRQARPFVQLRLRLHERDGAAPRTSCVLRAYQVHRYVASG